MKSIPFIWLNLGCLILKYKYFFIVRNEGKLICQSRTLDNNDINYFIDKLNVILKYDYLNSDYLKQLKILGRRKLVGPDRQTEIAVLSCYYSIKQFIMDKCQDTSGVFANIINNAFFYCLIKKYMCNISILNGNRHSLPIKLKSYLLAITGINTDAIENLLSLLINTYVNNDIEKLLKDLDNLIYAGMVEYASGF